LLHFIFPVNRVGVEKYSLGKVIAQFYRLLFVTQPFYERKHISFLPDLFRREFLGKMAPLIIKNGKIVNHDRTFVSDVLIRNGKIAKVGENLDIPEGPS